MIKNLVTPERPVAIIHEVMEEFADADMVVNCGQIVMCDAGSAELSINYHPVEMKPGTIVIMRAGDVVHGDAASDDYRVTCLAFDTDVMREASFRLESVVSDYLARGFITTDEWAGTYLHRMVGMLEPVITDLPLQAVRDIAVMLVRSFFLVCYYRYVHDNPDVNAQGRRADELFSQFFSLLITHHTRERSVGWYAEQMGVTPRYLNQIVNRSSGHSAKQVIDDYVTLQLKMALLVSDESISEIAGQYNFESLSFFSGYFKKRTGMTPQQFRNRRG